MKLKATIVMLFAGVMALPALAGSMGDSASEPSPMAAAGGNSGLYLFGMVGAADGDPSYTYLGFSTTDVPVSGGIGTIGIGKELKHGGGWSVRGELDISYTDISSDIITGSTTPCLVGEGGCYAEVNSLATARIVAAYEGFGRTMPYFTLGVAAGDANGFADDGACTGGSDGPGTPCSFDETMLGWTAGLGVFHKLSARWDLRGEYIFVDLGSPEFANPTNVTGSMEFGVLRLGANYRF